jgi:hypothetical protein
MAESRPGERQSTIALREHFAETHRAGVFLHLAGLVILVDNG